MANHRTEERSHAALNWSGSLRMALFVTPTIVLIWSIFGTVG
jgi:hypothetical protein